jgi:hypothetical protein
MAASVNAVQSHNNPWSLATKSRTHDILIADLLPGMTNELRASKGEPWKTYKVYARTAVMAPKPEYIKPFAEYDYEQGVHAGANDAKWVCPACKKPDWNEPHRERQKEGVPREPTTAIHL